MQRLGRAISSGKDKKQSLVIDLVNNYEILYENKEINQNCMTDLEALENTKIWMKQNNNSQYPQCVENASKIERRHTKRLNRLKNKYKKYIEKPILLENLDSRKKNEILEIINCGREFGLWNTTLVIEKIEDEGIITDLVDDKDPGFF